nr:uncharacterized protein LOC116432138 [Nomia melanderi]
MSDDVIYCAEQIKIPPTFPNILKVYAKAAVRTQPYDLLRWTCAYFRALANRQLPPVKDRLEYPPFEHPTGITPGYLRTLLNAFGPVEKISTRTLLERWQGMALPEASLYRILLVGRFECKAECHFYKFLAIACGFLGKDLLETMIYVCELLTEEPEGGSAMIPATTFLRLYGYLAELDCSGERLCAVCTREDAEEIFQPCYPTSGADETSTGTSHSSSYRVPCADVDEEEREEEGEGVTLNRTWAQQEDTGPRVSRVTASSRSRSSGILTVLKDYDFDARQSELDDAGLPLEGVEIHPLKPPKHGASIEPTDQPARSKSEPTLERRRDLLVDSRAYLADISAADTPDSFYSDLSGERGERSPAVFEEEDDYVPIGLEDILRGICECLEPVREASREATPPPVDPFEEFLKRMRNEADEGRLQTVVRVPGIGPPVSAKRVTAVGLWLADCARRQEGMVGPRNIRHFLCPELQENSEDDVDDD